MLKRVSIQNFKSLKDVTLDLQKVNLLIGPNNSGKTNFLKALEFFSGSVYKSIDAQNSLFPKSLSLSESILYQKDINNNLYMHFIFNNKFEVHQNQISLFELNADFQHFRLKSEKGNYYHEHWYRGDANINSESFYGREYSVTKTYLDFFFQKMKAFTVNPDVIAKPCPLYPGSENLSFDTSNLVAYLDAIRDLYPFDYEKIQGKIGYLVKDFQQIRFETVSPDKDLKKIYGDRTYKRIGLYNQIQGVTYWADELSEGTLYFLALLCIINQPNPPKLLLLEEPEKGIHPRRIREVMDFIRRLVAEKDIQVIMTTHSPLLLDEFAESPESVFVFDKDSEGATIVRNLQRDVIEPANRKNEELGIPPVPYTEALGEYWTIGFLGGVPHEAS